jgi:hypothetical protein
MKKWAMGIMAGLMVSTFNFTSFPALAQGVNDPYIQQREQKQQQRIQQGIKSGQLTTGEARRLEAQQGRIQATEDRMKADGNLTPQERARLTRKQNRANANIYRKKNNDQVAQ